VGIGIDLRVRDAHANTAFRTNERIARAVSRQIPSAVGTETAGIADGPGGFHDRAFERRKKSLMVVVHIVLEQPPNGKQQAVPLIGTCGRNVEALYTRSRRRFPRLCAECLAVIERGAPPTDAPPGEDPASA
jgi:hypothetical protein